MTDKERAKEYYRKLKPFVLCSGAEAEAGEKGYLAGLKAGRKELETENAELKKQLEMAEQVASDNPALFIQNCNLKAENEELKETVSRSGYRIAELKHEIDNLKEQNKTILEDNDTLNKWVDELKAQIEKMKCCANCQKERNKPEPLAVHISCMKCKNHSEWKLAE